VTFGTTSKFQKPTFNIILPFSSILAAAEIHGVTLRGWEIRARFPAPHHTVTLATPFSSLLSCHRRSLHRIFMSPRAPYFPHIYATTAQPDTDLARETFSTLAFSAKNSSEAGSSLFEDDCSVQNQFEFQLPKNGKVLLKIAFVCVCYYPILPHFTCKFLLSYWHAEL